MCVCGGGGEGGWRGGKRGRLCYAHRFVSFTSRQRASLRIQHGVRQRLWPWPSRWSRWASHSSKTVAFRESVRLPCPPCTYHAAPALWKLSAAHAPRQTAKAGVLDVRPGTRSGLAEPPEPIELGKKVNPKPDKVSFYYLAMLFIKRCSSAPRESPHPPRRSRVATALAWRPFAFAGSSFIPSSPPPPAWPSMQHARA